MMIVTGILGGAWLAGAIYIYRNLELNTGSPPGVLSKIWLSAIWPLSLLQLIWELGYSIYQVMRDDIRKW